MQQRVILEGELGNRFGREWNTNCDRLIDIFKLIECQREGYRAYMMECQENNIQYSVSRGDIPLEGEEELLMSVGADDIIVTPVPAGSKGNFGKIFAAILLIWGGWALMSWAAAGGTAGATIGTTVGGQAITAGSLGSLSSAGYAAAMAAGYGAMVIGTGLALRTLNDMLMPSPDTDKDDESHLFGGPINTTAEGVPVPIVYGEIITGGVVINATYDALKGPSSYGSTVSQVRTPDDTTAGNVDGLQLL